MRRSTSGNGPDERENQSMAWLRAAGYWVCVCMYHLGFDGCKFHVSCRHTRFRMKEVTVLPDDQSLCGNEEQRKALPTGGRDVGPSL